MDIKNVIIEDGGRVKYFPITSLKNISDIEKISEYINVNNIKIDNTTEKNLGDTINNIKNELKKHKHLATEIVETNDKNFITKEQLNEISKISLKANQEDVDSLKKSGVEINKVLVDALNSKKVAASTSDSIKTNVNKIKNIKVGDYSKGETIKSENVTIKYTKDMEPKCIWKYTDNEGEDKKVARIGSLGASDDGSVFYSTDYPSKERFVKISPTGRKEFEKSIYHEIWDMEIFNNTYIYAAKGPTMGTSSGKVIKMSTSSGGLLWENIFPNSVRGVGVNTKGYCCGGSGAFNGSSDGDMSKLIDSNGGTVWKRSERTRVSGVDIDENNNVYVGIVSGRTIKRSPSGSMLWEFTEHEDSVSDIIVDSDNNIYSGDESGFLYKINPKGEKIWKLGLTDSIHRIKIDKEDRLYVRTYDGIVSHVTTDGNKLWSYTKIESTSGSGIAVNKNNVFCTESRNTYLKLNKTNIDSVNL